MEQRSRGFTLIELAIVLVIVGLLLGGLFKGEELIRGARVRNLIAQEEEIRTAFFGFVDRYHALPGDDATADSTISCGLAPCLDGDGNGRIEAPNASGLHEDILIWSHLSAAGFLNDRYTMADAGVSMASDANSPRSPYGVHLQLSLDTDWGAPGNTANRLNLKSGGQIPADVLAEIDGKVDDGRPYSGSFQFSPYAPGSLTAPVAANCVESGAWSVAGAEANCGAATLF